MSKHLKISISATSSAPSQEHLRKALEVVKELYRLLKGRAVFYVGGYVGLMKEVVDELLSINAKVVLILPIEYEGLYVPEEAVIVRTGMSFSGRNVVLVRTGDLLLALGGGSGSLMEVIAALEMGKKVALLTGTGCLTDSLRNAFNEGIVDERKRGCLYFIEGAGDLKKIF